MLKSYAMQVHESIMRSGAAAASFLAEMCKGLKKMRDDRLYRSLGYDDFDVYCEDMAHIRARQAYNYIATYERLGDEFLQSNAQLGITKLELISRLPGDIAAEITEDGSAADMSVKEIKALIEENKRMTGQITLIADQLNEMTAKSEELARQNEELEQSNKDLTQCKSELETQLFERPIEVVEKDISDEQKNKIAAEARASAESELKKKYDAEAKAKIEKEKARLQKKYEERVKEIEDAEAEKERLTAALAEKEKFAAETLKEIETLERKLSSASGDGAVVKIYFQTIQETFNKAVGVIDTMEPKERGRYKTAFATLLEKMIESVDEFEADELLEAELEDEE